MFDYQKTDAFLLKAEEICKLQAENEAFESITMNLKNVENKYLNECLQGLNYLRSEKCLLWIEENIFRTENVTSNWGHLAAVSNFNWKIAEKWIDAGRPLSLVSLDAINFCTTKGDRLNQSLLLREINPRILDRPNLEVIARKILDYKAKDNSPRVKKTVETILKNLFD